MAYRKTTTTHVIEPLAGTDPVTALADYNSDKSFIEGRYGVNGTSGSAGSWTIVTDDNNKKITLTYTDLEWDQPS